eukprot:TRINITY_DN6160_c0_g1_i1.p1 TRINITY_DN6160_c0_g1~~TRINITY_DN6160_c0_g1_i1.p1  ORF type:complete len:433 (+),score=33.80 TRINITY_DN6160_c0_g1_i1:125-1423(+)
MFSIVIDALTSWQSILLICFLLTFFHFFRDSSVSLFYKDSTINQAILNDEKFRTQVSSYTPPLLLSVSHFHTLFAVTIARGPSILYTRELLKVEPLKKQYKGGVIALDYEETHFRTHKDGDIIVLILHGASGSSQDAYVRYMVSEVKNKHWQAVVCNARGCGIELATAQTYCGSYTDDFRQAVLHVHRKYPNSPLFGAGYSLGANIIAKYAGEEGDNCLLSGVVSIGNGFDLNKCGKLMAQSLISHYVYSATITHYLVEYVRKFVPMFASDPDVYARFAEHIKTHFGPPTRPTTAICSPCEMKTETPKEKEQRILDLLSNVHYLRQFDTHLTCVVFGYRDADDYYTSASSGQIIDKVARPLLVLNALDDPVMIWSAIPVNKCISNPNVIIARTRTGGHSMVCFSRDMSSWTACTAVSYFESIIKLKKQNASN